MLAIFSMRMIGFAVVSVGAWWHETHMAIFGLGIMLLTAAFNGDV